MKDHNLKEILAPSVPYAHLKDQEENHVQDAKVRDMVYVRDVF